MVAFPSPPRRAHPRKPNMVADAPPPRHPLRIGDLVTIYETPPSLWHVTGTLLGIARRGKEHHYRVRDHQTGHIEEIKRSEIRRIERHETTTSG